MFVPAKVKGQRYEIRYTDDDAYPKVLGWAQTLSDMDSMVNAWIKEPNVAEVVAVDRHNKDKVVRFSAGITARLLNRSSIKKKQYAETGK